MSDVIIGRNPVMEALRAERDMEKIVVLKGAEGSIKKILGMAKDKGIPIHYSEKVGLDRIAGGGNHQGIVAYVSAYGYADVEDMLAAAKQRGEAPFLVILDNIEDPHNFGAILRTAETAGAHGVIIPKRHSAGITETVVKASAGAVEYVPCAKVSNLAQTIDKLKEKGIWIYGCDMDGGAYYETDMRGACALVVGGEGAGVGRLIREKCDYIVSIPMKGKINSLNASNAAAVILHEISRQRTAEGKKGQ